MKKNNVVILIFTFAVFLSCGKSYYKDTGLVNPNFNGNIYEYLQSKPLFFDTLVRLIDQADLKNYLTDSSITFFAPADSSITRTYYYINQRLFASGRDTLPSLFDIKPAFWRSMLLTYMFDGVRGLEDFPQIDFTKLRTYPGEFIRAKGGKLMNIGVEFFDAGGIKYKGYRRLSLNYLNNESSPYVSWVIVPVATSNVRPKNGFVHVLNYNNHYFGFNPEQAWLEAASSGINN